MFPLIGILVAVGLVFKLKGKGTMPPATTSTPRPIAPTKGATNPVKPWPIAPHTTAPVKPTSGAIEGFNLPLVLSPTLHISQYNPKNNSVVTPPIVNWENTIFKL